MVHTIVEGTFRQTNLTNESSEYLAQREELRLAEIELMRQRERVAELRRHLPLGALIEDYQFEEGSSDLNAGDAPLRTVRLSELFTQPHRSLITAHPWMAPDIRERGIDLLAPIWHFLDLTPQGRGNWYASLAYGAAVHAASQ